MDYLRKITKSVIPYGIAKKIFDKPSVINTSEYPIVYNKYGEIMRYFYIKDKITAHLPYSLMSGRMPRQIIWDRYNSGLTIQMYGHRSIFDRNQRKDNVRQFGLVLESEAIIPDVFQDLMHKCDAITSLDGLFTYSEKLLDKYQNAKFIIANGVWYGTKLYGGNMSIENYNRKDRLISIVASSKSTSFLHKFRADLARKLKAENKADALGTAVGQYFEKISDAFDRYMYNVAIENNSDSYYFTEKILDCFASMTVPIYYGAPKISKFFNEDGIIVIKEPSMECVEKTLVQCSRQDYFARIEAIKDNYIRVQKYLSPDDYLIDNYKELF